MSYVTSPWTTQNIRARENSSPYPGAVPDQGSLIFLIFCLPFWLGYIQHHNLPLQPRVSKLKAETHPGKHRSWRHPAPTGHLLQPLLSFPGQGDASRGSSAVSRCRAHRGQAGPRCPRAAQGLGWAPGVRPRRSGLSLPREVSLRASESRSRLETLPTSSGSFLPLFLTAASSAFCLR